MKIIKKLMMITPLMLSLTAMAPISSCALSTNSTKSTNILDSSVASSETHNEDIKVKNKDQLTSLQVGKQAQIQTEILPENALVKNITYESLNEDIATVTPNGIINAHKQGRVKIYAKAKICVKAKCKWWPFDVVSVYDEFYVNVFTEGVNIKFTSEWTGELSASIVAQKGSTLNEIISNYNISCTPNEGYRFDKWVDENNNPISIDSQINNDMTIKATYRQATFANDTWENIIKYADQGLEKLYTVYGPGKFIGLERKIMINNREHIVKVIGEGHDTCTMTGKKAALTFQLMTLLSDADGNAIRTQWDTGNNYNYTHGYLKGNLTGNGGKRSWDTTAYELLPSDLRKGIKRVNKTIWEWNSEGEDGHFVDYDDYLFALTCTEFAYTDKDENYHTEGTPYRYWVDHQCGSGWLDVCLERKLKDANGENEIYWLASPSTCWLGQNAWCINTMRNYDVDIENSNAVTFGFCI